MAFKKKIFVCFIIFFNIFMIYSNNENLIFLRPVPDRVKLIHGFGTFLTEEKKFIITCFFRYMPDKDIDFSNILIKGMSKGIVLDTWEDKPMDYQPDFYKKYYISERIDDIEFFYYFFLKKNIDIDKNSNKSGIIIDYGYYDFTDKKGNVYGIISNIIPIVKIGDKIDENTIIAKFTSKEHNGYDPILTVCFVLIDSESKKIISYLNLLPNK